MNLVLHPSSADRYIPTQLPKPRRRPTVSGQPVQRPPQSPTPHNASVASNFPLRPVGEASTNSSAPQQSSFPYPFPDQFQFQYPSTPWSYPPPPDRHPPQYPQSLPSIQAFGRPQSPSTAGESWNQDAAARDETDVSPFRAWNTEHQTMDSSAANPPSAAIDPHLRPNADAVSITNSENAPTSHGLPATSDATLQGPQPLTVSIPPHSRYQQDPYDPRLLPVGISPVDTTIYGHIPYGSAPVPVNSSTVPSSPAPTSATPATSYPRHAYTRTLVGPLSANATRLLDEHRKPGIFFLFQDLSIRTEGTFRLRIRLMNVGGPPAPNAGATCVHTDVSPVLAQTFTEPFVVYSAKRFPGVPDTTALSIAFGNQGQKLPLRNRHGSSKRRRMPGRQDDDSGSDGDSD